MENGGSVTGYASQPPSSGADARNIAGFYEFTLELIDFSAPRTFLNAGGVDEHGSAATVAAWPNPVNDMLKVDLSDYNAFRAEIFDQSGRIIRMIGRLEHSEVNVEALKPGIYFLRLSSKNENKQFITKFIRYD
jgi:hypothetical protein